MGAKTPKTPADDAALTAGERARFLARAAALGCDEHRARCELAAMHRQELDRATYGAAKSVIRMLEQEQRARQAQPAERTGGDHATA